MSVAEDRRRVTFRLQTLQVAAIVVFVILGMSFWFLQVDRAQALRGAGREQPPAHAGAARAPRRAARSVRGPCWSRTGTPSPSRSSASTRPTCRAPIRLLSQVAGLDPEAGRADRRAPPQRAGLPADRHRRGRVAGAGGRRPRPAPRVRAARRGRGGSAHAAISRRRAGGAPVRLRRRSQRFPGGRRRQRRARSSVSRAWKRPTTTC